MTSRVVRKATAAEFEASNTEAKRNGWVVWFVLGIAILPGMLMPLLAHVVRHAPWVRPYVIGTAIDVTKVMLVFSVVMIAFVLWRVYTTHKRPRA